MEIFTAQDANFPSIQEMLKQSLPVGEYDKDGDSRKISLAKHVLLVSIPTDPQKIGVCYARSYAEAELMASRLLAKALKRGHLVQVEPGYESLISSATKGFQHNAA
jgi:hypothetical protein